MVLPGPPGEALVAHLSAFVAGGSEALVFVTVNETVPARSNLTEILHRATTAAGVPRRFHDLRHCAQVPAAESGATLAGLMARMGHATPDAAQVYMHVRGRRDRAIADSLGAAMRADGVATSMQVMAS